MTLWFQLASASVNLGNSCNVREALEEGLNCSRNHWPCMEKAKIKVSEQSLVER